VGIYVKRVAILQGACQEMWRGGNISAAERQRCLSSDEGGASAQEIK